MESQLLVDKHLRFIVGKCNPVLLIPGLFTTKLFVKINYNGLYTNEKETTFHDLRVFCGDTVCNDTSIISEEHPLMIALSDKAFSILHDDKNKYTSCLGFFMNFFQNEKNIRK